MFKTKLSILLQGSALVPGALNCFIGCVARCYISTEELAESVLNEINNGCVGKIHLSLLRKGESLIQNRQMNL